MTNATLTMMQFNHEEERVAGACLETAQHSMVTFTYFLTCVDFFLYV